MCLLFLGLGKASTSALDPGPDPKPAKKADTLP